MGGIQLPSDLSHTIISATTQCQPLPTGKNSRQSAIDIAQPINVICSYSKALNTVAWSVWSGILVSVKSDGQFESWWFETEDAGGFFIVMGRDCG